MTLKRFNLSICLVALFGCDTQHEARPTLEGFLTAAQYGDAQRAFGLHMDSTRQGPYCEEAFGRLLTKARENRDEAECGRVAEVTGEDLQKLPDELRLALQVAEFTCRNPDGTCLDFARESFEHASEKIELEAWSIRELIGDDATAVGYVDLTLKGGKVERRTIALKKVGNDWRVRKGFLIP